MATADRVTRAGCGGRIGEGEEAVLSTEVLTPSSTEKTGLKQLQVREEERGT